MITPELFTIEMRRFLDDINANMDKQTLLSYYERLSEELDDESFLRAIERLKKEWVAYGKDYPSKLDFIRAAELSDDELEEIANEAYNIAKETAIYEGCYVSPEFEDSIIGDVINNKFGGWLDFHNLVAYPDRDDSSTREKFVRAYKIKAKRKEIRNPKLVGYSKTPRKIKVRCNYTIPVKKSMPVIEDKNKEILNKLGLQVKRMA